MAWTVCPTCPTLVPKAGKCDTCKAAGRAASDKVRRPDGNPYNSKGHASFRAAVLRRDPSCVLCGAPSTIADHWPVERRDLVAQGMDPDDPERGRGTCKPCHDRHTAATSQGGWNAR